MIQQYVDKNADTSVSLFSTLQAEHLFNKLLLVLFIKPIVKKWIQAVPVIFWSVIFKSFLSNESAKPYL